MGAGLLAVGGDFGREVLDAAGAAALTQDVAVQRVTAPPLALRGQQETALLMERHFSQLTETLMLNHDVKVYQRISNPLSRTLDSPVEIRCFNLSLGMD